MIEHIMMSSLLGILNSHKKYNDEEFRNVVHSHKRTICEQAAGKDISWGRQYDIMKRH